ncbi:DEAD/DEAH box helicase family protein [Marinobacter sp. 1-3A]|uniref:DEAD/DEAH box helicase family protein n=1 Tax=Marinobacter sp. 1-3A TaxID=2582920 RepID=UPI001904258C|nr:DEAD/DEAH box helicase family protein [Marinobacter sp. 1-3A]MBK1871598.1 DEAD/DEAH box helicase family protein [Marinobacter sp. 1-3A]
MVDFAKLRARKKKSLPIDPLEIFRRLPKPPQINDLYTSQSEVLKGWFSRRDDRDVVLKLHTGGGKTLVGLLIAQSSLNEQRRPVLYLAPNNQLVRQTLEKAQEYGIPAVEYSNKGFQEDFQNSGCVLVANYKSLFNGRSRFGLTGSTAPVEVGAVILDDAHVAFSDVRASFTIEVERKGENDVYENLTDLFRETFKASSQIGTFDDIRSGDDLAVLEVPHWAWHQHLDTVRELLTQAGMSEQFAWRLVRDSLEMCQAFISRNRFTITPVLPLTNLFPTFSSAPRRIYMSATIADDSELIRTFGASKSAVESPLRSRSLAGVSERMILIPSLMDYAPDAAAISRKLLSICVDQKRTGAIVITPSNHAATKWTDVAYKPSSTSEVNEIVGKLQKRELLGPVVFANRYDGIDLPGDSCRLLIMDGLPKGTSDYELHRAVVLQGGESLARIVAQRIEQGIGRAARGAGDYCVVLLVGSDLSAWIAKDANFEFLTAPTKAQLDMGRDVSKDISSDEELIETVDLSFTRATDWTSFHAEQLADLIDDQKEDSSQTVVAALERKAIENWKDGHVEKAIDTLQKAAEACKPGDKPLQGYLRQLAAKIADHWGNKDLADSLQQSAFATNRALHRPKVKPPYRQLNVPTSQAKNIVERFANYRVRRGTLSEFESVVSNLNAEASASNFEQSLTLLGKFLGFSSERFDVKGKGPDVLWLMPGNIGVVLEAKSRKKATNPLNKDNHGQLLVADEWFKDKYPGFQSIRVSVHPNSFSTDQAEAHNSFVLTYESLQRLITEARQLVAFLAESKLPHGDLELECSQHLERSKIRYDQLAENFFIPFKVVSSS